jgi:hypothetical protein
MSNLSTSKSQTGMPAGEKSWPKWLRRGPMELVACVFITLGILMLLQPFALILYTWSFVTMLFGTVMFTVVSKLPQ